MVQIIHKRPRGGKPVIDLTKKPVKDAANTVFKSKEPNTAMPPLAAKVETKPLAISAAPDGPPIAPDLPEKHRGPAPWSAQRSLTEQQVETINRIIQKAGEGHAKTLGLRLVLAAAEDEQAAAWPIGLLAKAFSAAGQATESHAVYQVMQGCRTARFRDMAAAALEAINKRMEGQVK